MTPSAPPVNDLRIISGCTIPEHITRIIRILGGYCIREVPARSAAAYEHQLQQKAIIFGSKLIVFSNWLYAGCRSRHYRSKSGISSLASNKRCCLRKKRQAEPCFHSCNSDVIPFIHTTHASYTVSAASIWLSSCLKVNPATEIPRLGQVPWQSPQPLQWARLTDTSLCTSPLSSFFSTRLIA